MTSLIKHTIGLVFIGLSLFGACKSSETSPSGQVSLKLNQSARVATDLTIQIDTLRDSRCPIGAECLVAGDVWVSLSLHKDAETQKRQLSLYGRYAKVRSDSTIAQFGSALYSIVLRDVVPYTELMKPYVEKQAILQVTKL